MVATSPAVARRALALGKYRRSTRRGFCAPQPSVLDASAVDGDLGGVGDQQLHDLVVVAFHHQARLLAEAIHLLERAVRPCRGLAGRPTTGRLCCRLVCRRHCTWLRARAPGRAPRLSAARYRGLPLRPCGAFRPLRNPGAAPRWPARACCMRSRAAGSVAACSPRVQALAASS